MARETKPSKIPKGQKEKGNGCEKIEMGKGDRRTEQARQNSPPKSPSGLVSNPPPAWVTCGTERSQFSSPPGANPAPPVTQPRGNPWRGRGAASHVGCPSRAELPSRANPLATRGSQRLVRPGRAWLGSRALRLWVAPARPPLEGAAATGAEQTRGGFVSPACAGSEPLSEDTLLQAPKDAGSSQRPNVTSRPFACSRSPGFRDVKCWRGGGSGHRMGWAINNRTGHTTPWTVTSPSQEKINNI